VVLLDTCSFLWLASNQKKLSSRARELISSSAGSIFLSSASAFEIALKHGTKRLILPLSPEKWLEKALEFHGVREVPLDWRIAARVARIPASRGDFCDRVILATAELGGLLLITPDQRLRSYRKVKSAW